MVTVHKGVERVDVEAVNAKETRAMYATRRKIFPKKAVGFFRNLKWSIMVLLYAIYFITPWIRWDRGPYAPDQALLVDLANRRFYFFSIEIWPQEFYYIAGMLIMAGFVLFFVSSSIGRAWCGYACWQTIWVDLFIAIDRMIVGDRNARIKLDKAPWTGDKIAKYALKHFLWILVAFITGLAFILFFADAPTLFVNFFTGKAPTVAYATVAILGTLTYTFAGFAREQICTYACPWPRIQGAMVDEHSLVVTYNDWRGEPRILKKKEREALGDKAGDCVDCNACVAVCPQGIDIRDGEQLECITCALCIDACNAVMDKVGKPRGLISYATFADHTSNKRGDIVKTTWRSFIRPRTFVYMAVFAVVATALLTTLAMRDRLGISVLHDRNPQYVRLSDGSIRNGYTVKILNMIPQPRTFRLTVKGIEGAKMKIAGLDKPPASTLEVTVSPDQVRSLRVYVTIHRKKLSSPHNEIQFTVEDVNGDEKEIYKAVFEGP